MSVAALKPSASTAAVPPIPAIFAGTPPRRYPEADLEFFREAVREAQLESLFGPVALDDKLILRFKRKFDTACWAFLPPHRMYIGLDLFQKEMVKPELPDELQRKYIANHFHHERGHGLFTTRDMKKVKAMLKVMSDCPFSLYNLFEDAYMEEAYRQKMDYRFEWLTMENLGFNSRPESIFFALIQAEGDAAVVEKAIQEAKAPRGGRSIKDLLLAGAAATEGALVEALLGAAGEIDPEEAAEMEAAANAEFVAQLKAWFPQVVLFYKRTVAAKESMALMPIIKAWIDMFGMPPAGDGPSDLAIGASLAEDSDALADFERDSEKLDEGDEPPEVEGTDDASPPVAQKGTVLDKLPEYDVNLGQATQIAFHMRKLFQQFTRRVMTEVPRKRMSARNYVLGRPCFVQNKIEGRGKRKLVLIVDCSGSMGGMPIESARVLVAALSILAREGSVEGHVVFSGGQGKSPAYETYKLPVDTKTIERAGAIHGSEGIEGALRGNIGLCKDADLVMVYTDANITDQVVKKAALHAQSVFTWGLYVGSASTLQTLLKYFDKALIRDSLESLVDAMLSQIR